MKLSAKHRVIPASIVLTLFLASCGNNNPSPPPIPVVPVFGWSNFANSGFTPLGTTFQIGTNPIPGYVVERPPAALAAGKIVTLNYTVTGNGPYTIVDPYDIPPASITLFVWRYGDDLGGSNTGKASYRFWCPQRVVLASGNGTLSCALDGNVWTNVIGQKDAGGFAAALANAQGIGFTFGGAYFYGHGVTDSNTQFTINSFTVQ